jgi:signal transduction histidine kinase
VDRPAIRPGSLRRRLSIAFLLVAGLSAAALAVASYAIVREARLSDSVDRSLEQSRFNLILANETLAREPSVQEINQLLAAYERRGGFETVGTTGDRRFSSTVSLGMQEVPPPLRALVSTGKLGYERVDVADTSYLVVGGQVKNADTELYYFYSEDRLWDELAQLRNVLLAALGVVALLGALIGAVLARRILAPVGRASQAAHSLAEGLLETRLPVESGDEFGVWAASFNEMADALEAKIRALSESQARERRFTSDVSHELRTPLTAIQGYLETLLGGALEEREHARRFVEIAFRHTERLGRLLNDLTDLSNIELGKVSLRLGPTPLGALVDSVLELVAAKARDGEVALHAEVSEGLGVRADHDRLLQVLINLVDNAVKYTPPGGAVTVQARRTGDGRVALSVSDTGIGIPRADLPRITERFYRVDKARSRELGGTGLGLAIVKHLVLAHGGDLAIESEEGRGTTVRVLLPDGGDDASQMSLPMPPAGA